VVRHVPSGVENMIWGYLLGLGRVKSSRRESVDDSYGAGITMTVVVTMTPLPQPPSIFRFPSHPGWPLGACDGAVAHSRYGVMDESQ